jgi:hypothetical protein
MLEVTTIYYDALLAILNASLQSMHGARLVQLNDRELFFFVF